MKTPRRQAKPDAAERVPGLFRPRDLVGLSIPKSQLAQWVREGRAEQLGRGLYRRTDAQATELETVAMVAKQSPRSVICLLTALHVHGIGTQAPSAVWLALDRKARAPRMGLARLRVVRFAPQYLEQGVEKRDVLGVGVRITTPARTIVDCFRYRRKIGLDVAIEALADGLRSRRVTAAQVSRVAASMRMAGVMKPYLESLSR